MAEKRSRKAEEETKETKANEQIRRKAGKASAILETPTLLNLSLLSRKWAKLRMI
jgi:hypothetical protein